MKKLHFLIVAALAVLIAGCAQNNNKPAEPNKPAEQSTLAEKYGLFYIEEGDLWLYDLDTHCADRYNNETDSIVRAVLAKNNVLYYSVAKDGELLLRCLDLNDTNPMPEQLADWDVPVEGRTELDGFGAMYLNHEETQVALERDVRWFAGLFYNLAVYDIASKTVTVQELYKAVMDGDEFVTFEDISDNSSFDRWGPESVSSDPMGNLLENVDNDIYYVGDGQRVCLTDQIDMENYADIGLGKEDFDVDASVDPTHKRALIGYNVGLGDGTIGFYVLSSIDGKQQKELEGSDYETSNPTWLPDGSLLYVGYDDGAGLFLLDLDGNIRKIAESEIYSVLH